MIDLIFIFLSAIFLSHDIMPRIFIGNFDFEHRLARPKGQLPAKLDRINAQLFDIKAKIADKLAAHEPVDTIYTDKVQELEADKAHTERELASLEK